MKKSALLILAIFSWLTSCSSIKYIVSEPVNQNSNSCPKDGTCSFELIPKKSIIFKSDEFGNVYPEISEGNKTLLKYSYNNNPPKNTQDGHYSEIIYAELDSTITKTNLKNEDLKKVKLHFGRLCFCKGQTGYYPIKKGEFIIKKSSKDSINISIKFEQDEVPQIISTINETISIK